MTTEEMEAEISLLKERVRSLELDVELLKVIRLNDYYPQPYTPYQPWISPSTPYQPVWSGDTHIVLC